MKILAIVPARGNSKGIRRKNLRLFNGKPLVSYVISTLKKVSNIDDIVVTSEDDEILNYCLSLGVKVHKRPSLLSSDDVTLDPVVYEAYNWYRSKFGEVECVLTVQPTSPLISENTIESAIKKFLEGDVDTIISVIDDTHLSWRKIGEEYFPEFTERLNRQYLSKRLRETGAFLITKSSFVTSKNRIGNKLYFFEVPPEESLDIDETLDWLIGETLANRLKILIVTFGNKSVGTGHFSRTLSLADAFLGHDVEFALVDSDDIFSELLQFYGYSYKKVKLGEVKSLIRGGNFNLVINDILDTTREYMEGIKEIGVFVVNFEDLGEGSKLANIVFNDMYGGFEIPDNYRVGYKYAVLNENFLVQPPNSFSEIVKNVLISFGGVDQNNLTFKTLSSIKDLIKQRDISVKIIVGSLYSHFKELEDFISTFNLSSYVSVLHNVKSMASEMNGVDLGFTSNGRTVYELASMRIPVISIAQNDRETLHLFARTNPGVKYLGIACTVSEASIRETFVDLLDNTAKRKLMYNLLPYKEIRDGLLNVKEEIIFNYRRWRKNDYKTREENY